MGDSAVVRFLRELRRRRVFRVTGLYVVAVWLLMQAANFLFPAWGIPDAAITYLLWAGLLGFPVALVFGWVFHISAQGIRRTQPVTSQDELLCSLPLRRADYAILTAFLVVVAAIVHDTSGRVMKTATAMGSGEWRPSAAEIEPHSVAVLPFADLSPERDQEYFTDGISEEILNRLSAFRELKVIARTSSFAFKDSGYDIARISGLLGVKYLLQGSMRRDGQQLRMSAQLVDNTGVQVWSSSFDRQLGGIFQLQDEIAEAVARSIAPQIAPPEAEQRRRTSRLMMRTWPAERSSPGGNPAGVCARWYISTGELGHWWPQPLPGGDAMLFTGWITPMEKARLVVYSLRTGQQKVVFEGGSCGRYLPTGHLVFMRSEGSTAVPFDLMRSFTPRRLTRRPLRFPVTGAGRCPPKAARNR